MLRAVIFDFDGIIADSERLHLAGFRLALAALDISISEAAYFERYLGFDDRDAFRAILTDNARAIDDGVVRELMASKERAFRDLVRDSVRIFPGVRELLQDLRKAPQPVATAIGSGALRSEISLILEASELRTYFDVVVSADDVAHGKPDPETFIQACHRLAESCDRLTAEECLVIEDSTGGLDAAARAGMKRIGVTNSYSADQLEADLVVASLEDLSYQRCAALFD
jgi:beta-phosphoglucomutase